ncbi:pre-rRNA-processing protein pno1 [Elasticomyces elasticus]|nr:pre-rRNA-processing protein pno1 [Elasticomyces elasticus]KAK3646632.1 pre-rRNA-processing protein pno1 [Elasticomyces elasticus]KAK4913792.1 pre-rRNA-processing protein pno1 [Elasticomyces elasticus]KAK5758003.1 pre-rRNA-processing protein pno1 [Elasticomyces elasticus]
MPAPTAIQRAPSALAIEQDAPETIALPQSPTLEPTTNDLDMNMDDAQPLFAPEKPTTLRLKPEERKIRIPPHRMTPLKNSWPKIYPPLVEHLKLQVRMNLAKKAVELRTSPSTTDTGAIQKGADFLQAFTLGFDLDDAIALLRLDDLYIQSFEIKDVKTLSGEHLSRAVGRIAGKDGKTKFAIENASRTRIVLADSKVHILGGFKNLNVAREAIVSLILGSPPGKVYGNLRTVGARMKERF